jgi:hypothetical protein
MAILRNFSITTDVRSFEKTNHYNLPEFQLKGELGRVSYAGETGRDARFHCRKKRRDFPEGIGYTNLGCVCSGRNRKCPSLVIS